MGFYNVIETLPFVLFCSKGCTKEGNSKRQKRRNQCCKCTSKDAKKLDHSLEMQSLICHQKPKVRIRSYSQDLSFPSLDKEVQVDVTSCGQNDELNRLQGLSAVKTVVINL